jgi:hypothetical protein
LSGELRRRSNRDTTIAARYKRPDDLAGVRAGPTPWRPLRGVASADGMVRIGPAHKPIRVRFTPPGRKAAK